MRTMLVAKTFPPGIGSGGVRTEAIARLATEAGWEVIVVSGATERPFTYRDGGVVKSPPSARGELPEVTQQGTRRSMGRFVPKRVRLALRRLIWPDVHVMWATRMLPRALAVGRERRPDLIYCSALPASGTLLAWVLAKSLGVPWVAEFRDLWTLNGYKKSGWLASVLERVVLASADSVVCVTPEASAAQAAFLGREVACVPSGVDQRGVRAATAKPSNRCWIVHTGLLYDGRRGPTPLIEALARVAEDGAGHAGLEVHFAGADSAVAERLAVDLGVEGYVKNRGLLPRREARDLQSLAAGLVIFARDEPDEVLVVPAKLYEYLAAGPPILYLGTAGAELDRVRSLIPGRVTVAGWDEVDEIGSWVRGLVNPAGEFHATPEVPYDLTQQRMVDDVMRIALDAVSRQRPNLSRR